MLRPKTCQSCVLVRCGKTYCDEEASQISHTTLFKWIDCSENDESDQRQTQCEDKVKASLTEVIGRPCCACGAISSSTS